MKVYGRSKRAVGKRFSAEGAEGVGRKNSTEKRNTDFTSRVSRDLSRKAERGRCPPCILSDWKRKPDKKEFLKA